MPEKALQDYIQLMYDHDYDGYNLLVVDTLRDPDHPLAVRMFHNIKSTQVFINTRVLMTDAFDPITAGYFSLTPSVPDNLPINVFHKRFVVVRLTHSHDVNALAVAYVRHHIGRATPAGTFKSINVDSQLGQFTGERLISGETRRSTTNIGGKPVQRFRPRKDMVSTP